MEHPADAIGDFVAVNEHQFLVIVREMAVPDPAAVGGMAAFFTVPFVTIEDVEIVDRHTIAVLDDNNFPAGGGRAPDRPDENELILIRLDRALDVARGL
jgi:hypothetical protein